VTGVNSSPTNDMLNNGDQQSVAIANAAGDDILDQMVTELQTKYGVTVNRNVAEQAMVR
jgi:peptidyl-prolyl cis-trans isomerase D